MKKSYAFIRLLSHKQSWLDFIERKSDDCDLDDIDFCVDQVKFERDELQTFQTGLL